MNDDDGDAPVDDRKLKDEIRVKHHSSLLIIVVVWLIHNIQVGVDTPMISILRAILSHRIAHVGVVGH